MHLSATPRASAGAPIDSETVARRLSTSLRASFPGDDVTIRTFGSTVTIARGAPAVQIVALDVSTFQVARRRRETFHTIREPVGQSALARIVHETISLGAA